MRNLWTLEVVIWVISSSFLETWNSVRKTLLGTSFLFLLFFSHLFWKHYIPYGIHWFICLIVIGFRFLSLFPKFLSKLFYCTFDGFRSSYISVSLCPLGHYVFVYVTFFQKKYPVILLWEISVTVFLFKISHVLLPQISEYFLGGNLITVWRVVLGIVGSL